MIDLTKLNSTDIKIIEKLIDEEIERVFKIMERAKNHNANHLYKESKRIFEGLIVLKTKLIAKRS